MSMNGKAIMVTNVLENINYDRYEIILLNYRGIFDKDIKTRLNKLPIKIINGICFGGVKGLFGFLKKYNEILKREEFDVVHSHIWDQSGLFMLIARINRVPIRVVHCHTTSKNSSRYGLVKVFFRDVIIWKLFKELIKIFGNKYLACSEEAAEWLFDKKLVQEKKTTIIPNGIDLSKYKVEQSIKLDIHQKYNIPTNKKNILFVGRLIYQKNPLFLLEVFKELKKIDDKVHLTMVGMGVMKKEIDAWIEKNNFFNDVTQIEKTNEIPKLLSLSSLFLLPSNYEGLGIVLVEAQAAGVPCITSTKVPQEVQCGLVKFVDLEKGKEYWAKESYSLLMNSSNYSIDNKKLEKFDIKTTVDIISKIY